MKLTKDMIKFVQTMLNKHFGTFLSVDGIAGNNTKLALLRVPAIPTSWGINRQLFGMLQYGLTLEGLDAGPVDGFYGPQTDYAFDQWLSGDDTPWRDNEAVGAKSARWPAQDQAELIKFYGQPGENQGKANLPYTMKIAWNTKKHVNKFTCHEKVVQPIERIFTRVLDYYGPKKIKRLGLDMFGGCLNVRKMRGGTKWSTHAWGIAVDMDPLNNRLHWGSYRAKMGSEDYNKWFDFWEEEGAISLGRAFNYDWMHTQFATVR